MKYETPSMVIYSRVICHDYNKSNNTIKIHIGSKILNKKYFILLFVNYQISWLNQFYTLFTDLSQQKAIFSGVI